MSSLVVRCLSFGLVAAACASGAHQGSTDSESIGTSNAASTGGEAGSSATTGVGASTLESSQSTSASVTLGSSTVASSDQVKSDPCDGTSCDSNTTRESSSLVTSSTSDDLASDDGATSTTTQASVVASTTSQATSGTGSLHNDSANDSSTTSDTTTDVNANVDPSLPVTIWLAGDSTVANGNTPCPTGWGKHLAEFFNTQTTVRNSAAGGRSVRTWMYNVQTTMDDSGECELQRDSNGEPTLQSRWQEMLDDMKPGDVLLIQFGINDGSATCDRHVGLEAFKESYGVLAAAAKERGAQPVFITPVSAIGCSGSSPRGTRGEFVDTTIEAGEEHDVPVLELHARSVERYTELGFCPVAGGDVSASTTGPVGDYFCDDHTHFSSSGASDIASLVVELLIEQDVSVISHLK